jgi:hypothetical protein
MLLSWKILFRYMSEESREVPETKSFTQTETTDQVGLSFLMFIVSSYGPTG